MSDSTVTRPDARPRAGEDRSTSLIEALRRPRYEVLPLPGTAEMVDEYAPRDLPITVTVSPRRGLEPTIALTEALASRGYAVAPHLAACLVVDESHLRETLVRLDVAGVHDLFIVGGDGAHTAGDFSDAVALLAAMRRLWQTGPTPAPDRVGIAGYPEGHPLIPDAELIPALLSKESLGATYLVTQMCFKADRISAWIARARRAGVRSSVHVGVAGVVDRQKLLGVARRIGVGPSTRFLHKHRHGLARMGMPGGYSPDRLLQALAGQFEADVEAVAGLHIYTLGSLAATERWRRRTLDRLVAGAGDG